MISRTVFVVAFALTLLAGNTATAGAAPVLPRPSSVYAVGTTALHLTDANRPDPFVPERSRELMVSVFYPATDAERYPQAHYVSSALIPDLEKRFGVSLPGVLTNAHTGAPAHPSGTYPVVFYSPGAGVSRIWANGLAEDLASRGYVVVTMDHTYESPAVEFPGGRIVQHVPFPAFDQEVRQRYLAARLADMRFVLDSVAQLASGRNPDTGQRALPAGLDRALDLEHIGAVGHSLGGYLAVESMHGDRRIDAAVDLDGQLGIDAEFGRSVTEGSDRPVLVLTSAQAEAVGDANPSLNAFWQRGTGWRRHLTMRDSAHYDYTDMPLLVPDVARPAASTYIGPIAGARAYDLTRTYVAAMFDRFLRDRPADILDRPADPEFTVLR
ncbi:alpha/beta hydrolase family protein [Nocardia sp. NPDC127579]|uniref:alpha/beta hydrolase family protein n=1 Tax=Nocardia sp. NPDC127579 TaxID=3345402 RepID=UPI003639A5BD